MAVSVRLSDLSRRSCSGSVSPCWRTLPLRLSWSTQLPSCFRLPKDGEFRLPFGPVIPLLSCAIVGWLLLQVPLDEAVTIAALVGASVAVYATVKSFARLENT